MGWIISQNRKKHQRAMNKLMRQINKNIENDNLWLGRFYVRQAGAQWYTYEHSAELWVVLQFVDKATGFIYETAGTVNHWKFGNGSHLWLAMNDFIVEKVEVWSEDVRPGSSAWYQNINW